MSEPHRRVGQICAAWLLGAIPVGSWEWAHHVNEPWLTAYLVVLVWSLVFIAAPLGAMLLLRAASRAVSDG